MKRWIMVFAFMMVIGLPFTGLVHAEDTQGMPDDAQQGQGQGQGPGMMSGGPMKGGMMGMMHKDSMLATSDGGIVVMSGPRLIKYDRDLNLIKEVEMPKGKRPGPNSQSGNDSGSQNQAPVQQ